MLELFFVINMDVVLMKDFFGTMFFRTPALLSTCNCGAKDSCTLAGSRQNVQTVLTKATKQNVAALQLVA